MSEFISIDRMHEMLDEIAEELPVEFFNKLNGGIVLLPEEKISDDAIYNDLFTLGEYHRSGIGRYIKIYYGSFKRVFHYLSEDELKEKLRETLVHEFVHHLEGLAGLRDLEIEDSMNLEEYRKNRGY